MASNLRSDTVEWDGPRQWSQQPLDLTPELKSQKHPKKSAKWPFVTLVMSKLGQGHKLGSTVRPIVGAMSSRA